MRLTLQYKLDVLEEREEEEVYSIKYINTIYIIIPGQKVVSTDAPRFPKPPGLP